MSDEEIIAQRELLNNVLRESFRKMLELKKKSGQSVVTTDEDGNPIVISAQEAEIRASNDINFR